MKSSKKAGAENEKTAWEKSTFKCAVKGFIRHIIDRKGTWKDSHRRSDTKRLISVRVFISLCDSALKKSINGTP